MSVSSVAALALGVALLASILELPPATSAPVSRYDQRQEGEYNVKVRFGHYILLLIPVSIEEPGAPLVYDPFDFSKKTLPKKYSKTEEKPERDGGLEGSIVSPAVVVPVSTVSEKKIAGPKVPSALMKLHPVVQDISSDVLVALSPSVALAKSQPLATANAAVIAEKKTDLTEEVFVPLEDIAASDAVKKPGVKIPSLADKFVKETFVSEEVPVIDFVVPAAPVAIVKNKDSALGNKIDQSVFSTAVDAKETKEKEAVAISKPVDEVEGLPAHDITLEQIKKAKSISATLTILPKEPPNQAEVEETAEEAAFRERERILERVTSGIEVCSPDQVRDEEGNCTSIKPKRRSESLPLRGNVALVSGLSFGLSPATE